MSVITHYPSNKLVIGEVSHYHFYQPMNQTPRPSQKYQPTKAIIPSIPRQHSKAPVNSPLSFIREQKLPQNVHPTANLPSSQNLSSVTTLSASSRATLQISSSHLVQQHQLPFFAHSSSDLLKNLPTFPKNHSAAINRRRRKVSFDENVMVICTRFDDDDDGSDIEDDDIDTAMNIHDQPEGSFLTTTTSSTPPSYYGRRHSTGEQITDEQRQRKRWNTFVTNLKQWKYTKNPSPISPSSPSIV